MDGKNHFVAPGTIANRLKQTREVIALVYVGWPMQGDDEILAGNEPVEIPESGLLQAVDIRQQGVDHRIANKENPIVGDSTLAQVLVRELAGGKKIVGDSVGDEAIDFLGHRPVVRTNTRLDVGNLNMELLRGNGAGHGRGDIADHEAKVARGFEQQFFVAHHDLRRLVSLRAGADLQVDIRFWNAELFEEVVRHARVVVLAGMHQPVAQRATFGDAFVEGAQDGGDLHEIGAGAGDDVDQHVWVSISLN